MRNLETKYAGLMLRNPLIVGSSGLTSKADKNGKWEEAGAGAVVLKSLFEEQIEAQGDLLMAGASDYPEAEDYVRAYVRANGREEYLQLIRDSKAACHVIPVIASVNCYRADTWADFAAEIERAGADALELNVFYLDTDIHSDSREVLRHYSSILKDVRRRISIPIIMKIGKGFSTIPAFVNRLQGFGQFVVVPGFDNEVRSAFFDASHGQFDIGIGREEYHLYRGVDLLDPGEPEKTFIPAVDPCTEVHIEQYHIHRFVVQNRSDAVGRGGCDYPGKLWSQQQFHGRKDALVVVDHENGTLSFRLVHAFSLKVDLPLKRLFK